MNILKDLWKDKPLLIAVIVAIIGVVYILYKNNSSNVIPATSTSTSGTAGTGTSSYVDSNYYNNAPITSTTTTTGGTIATSLPAILSPAPKGTLGKFGAGKGDTNFWVYTVPAGQTLTSIAQYAKWGSDYTKLANYRNNLQILQAAGVNTSNPYAAVPAGIKISL